MNPKYDHPERREDEVFIGNTSIYNYISKVCGYRTARRGSFAYTSDGKIWTNGVPIFVKKIEIDEWFKELSRLVGKERKPFYLT